MKEKIPIKGHNIIFRAVLALFIIFLLLLIGLAISNILLKGFSGLRESLASAEIIFSIKLSIFTSVISTLLCITFAVPIAYGLERVNFPGKRVINTLLGIPLALPPIVSGIALLLLFGGTEFGKMLASIGLKFVFDVKGIILVQFFVNISYMINILKSTFADINPRLEFVGRTLGCSQFKTFIKITLPLARNGLIAATVITWSRSIGEFGATLMLAGATRLKTETLPVSLYLNMSTGDINLAMTSATIIIIISVISLSVFEICGIGKSVVSRIN